MKRVIKKTARKESSIQEDIRRLGVMVEAGNDKWDLVAEQYGDLAEQYGDLKKTLNLHTQILETHTEMFGKVFVDLSIIKEDIEFII